MGRTYFKIILTIFICNIAWSLEDTTVIGNETNQAKPPVETVNAPAPNASVPDPKIIKKDFVQICPAVLPAPCPKGKELIKVNNPGECDRFSCRDIITQICPVYSPAPCPEGRELIKISNPGECDRFSCRDIVLTKKPNKVCPMPMLAPCAEGGAPTPTTMIDGCPGNWVCKPTTGGEFQKPFFDNKDTKSLGSNEKAKDHKLGEIFRDLKGDLSRCKSSSGNEKAMCIMEARRESIPKRKEFWQQKLGLINSRIEAEKNPEKKQEMIERAGKIQERIGKLEERARQIDEKIAKRNEVHNENHPNEHAAHAPEQEHHFLRNFDKPIVAQDKKPEEPLGKPVILPTQAENSHSQDHIRQPASVEKNRMCTAGMVFNIARGNCEPVIGGNADPSLPGSGSNGKAGAVKGGKE